MEDLPTTEVPACPICTMTDLLDGGDYHECATCGHEWDKAQSDEVVVLDANGKQLNKGDDVTLVKDLKINGKSGRLKAGTKIKSINLVDGDHPIDGKVDGRSMLIKAEFVKLA
jgi:protein PhnA